MMTSPLLLLVALLSLYGQQSPASADPGVVEPQVPPLVAPTVKARSAGRPVLLPLPAGPLRAFSENDKAVHFVDQDSIQLIGGRVRVNQYTVFHPGAPSGGRMIVHWITETRVDCERRTVQSVRLSAYDEVGDEVLWMPTEGPEPVRPGTVQAELHAEICGSPRAAGHAPLIGWRPALAFARAHLSG